MKIKCRLQISPIFCLQIVDNKVQHTVDCRSIVWTLHIVDRRLEASFDCRFWHILGVGCRFEHFYADLNLHLRNLRLSYPFPCKFIKLFLKVSCGGTVIRSSGYRCLIQSYSNLQTYNTPHNHFHSEQFQNYFKSRPILSNNQS